MAFPNLVNIFSFSIFISATFSLASSFNCISAYDTEIKTIDKAIKRSINGLTQSEYQCLLSIPGIGPVYAGGILAEIGTITAFTSQDAVAKYAGLFWKQSQSGNYKADDTNLLSVDFSSKLSGSTLKVNEGIVWVNEKNELKGDYFTADNVNDNMFINAIKKIKWKKIKVISDDNGICGIDTNNQMYCWGIQSFYRNVATTNDDIGNTFMIPVFNTNLFELDKDYLVAEGGRTGYLTNMTEEEWKRDSDGAFFIKYPTYIGGFNYEFTFK